MEVTTRLSTKTSPAKASAVSRKGEKTNVEVLVEYVLDRCSERNEAQACFSSFFREVGKENPTGRVYTKQDVEDGLKKYNSIVDMYSGTDCKVEPDEIAASQANVRKTAKASSSPASLAAPRAPERQDLPKASSSAATPRAPERQEKQRENILENFTKRRKLAAASSAEGAAAGGSTAEPVNGPKRKTAAKAETGNSQLDSNKRQKKGDKKDKKSKRSTRRGEDEALLGSESEDGLSGEEEVDKENEDADAALLDDLQDLQKGTEIDDLYPAKVWEKIDPKVLPGHKGFNERATKVLRQLGVGLAPLQSTFDKEATCPPLQPHQTSVAFLLHPKSPITRLLVDHPTGSGKTREMIRALDNYFFDPRPKIPIFPKDHVCRNFYSELLRWPSRYRNYFCCERPEDAALISGVPDWRERRFHMWDLGNFPEVEVRRLCYAIREVLEMKGMFYRGMVRRSCKLAFTKKIAKTCPGEHMPRAPLRALGYTSAGGAFSNVVSGKPQSSLMKIGYEKGSENVYNNKVVLMDEVHNLLVTQTQYGVQLTRLRDLLYGAKNVVLAGFTGTPILSNPREGQTLLQIIKGFRAPKGDEGFLSAFPMRPRPLFPVSLPSGIPDAILTEQRKMQLVKEVEIHGETLKNYDWKRRSGYSGKLLRAYCNCCTYHGSFHEGRSGTKIRVLSFPEDCCPKLLAIALEVASKPEKAVIMTSRMSGYVVMLELMRLVATRPEHGFWVATMDQLSEFNHVSNLRGEVYRVLVADAAQCSEGVSFLAVRRTFISDVPATPSQFLQQCGRAIRMYGHRGLPEEEQTVVNQLYVATFPNWVDSSLACWALRAQSTSQTVQVKSEGGKEFEKKAQSLLARMNKEGGIETLENLKTRVDNFGMKLQSILTGGKSTTKAEILSTSDIIAFLDSNGFSEEAQSLRVADKKDWEKALAGREMKNAILHVVEASQEGLAAGSLTKICNASSLPSERRDIAEAAVDAPVIAEVDKPLNGNWNSGKEIVQILEDNLIGPVSGKMQLTSPTTFRMITVDGSGMVCEARLSEDRMKLIWNDGDEWERIKAAADESEAATDGVPKEKAMDILQRVVQLLHSVCQDLTSKAKPKKQAKLQTAGAPAVGDAMPDVFDIPLPDDDAPIATSAEPQVEESPWRLALDAGFANLLQNELVVALLRTMSPGFKQDRIRKVTPEQVRAWHEEFARLQNFAACMQALAAVQLALQDIATDSTGDSWRAKLAEHLQHLQSIEEIETAMDNAAIPADIAEATPVQLRKLRDELVELKTQGDVPQTKSRALVSAMQALYAAPNLDEASKSLKSETADEEALKQLMAQTHDFAPALDALRTTAVDSAVLSHLSNQSSSSSSSKSGAPAASSGGNKLEVVPGQVVKLHSLWSKPELNGQLVSTLKLIPETGQWECRILSSAYKESVTIDPSCFTFIQSSAKTTREMQGFIKVGPAEKQVSPSQPAPGKKVRLHSLVAKPELNGQIACIERFVKDVARWECRLLLDLQGQTVKVKETNLSVVHDIVDTLLLPTNAGLASGRQVMVHSLVAKPELNGQLAHVERLIPETGRWECRILSASQIDTMNLKTDNLAVVSADAASIQQRQLAPGQHVRLHSLKAKPVLNGQLACVRQLSTETGRWQCELLSDMEGEKVNVNPGNIAKVLEREESTSENCTEMQTGSGQAAVDQASSSKSSAAAEVPDSTSGAAVAATSDSKSGAAVADVSDSTPSAAVTEKAEPAEGKQVRLHSFSRQPQLNGQIARLGRLLPENGRWVCQIPGRTEMYIKPTNFEVLADDAVVKDSEG